MSITSVLDYGRNYINSSNWDILYQNIFKNEYICLIQSVFQYGNIGWSGLNQSTVHPLLNVQKRLV